MEFAKSAKNRSLLIPLAVAVFLVVLGIGAWIASQFTDQASQKSTVSIGSFEDLKLKEIFDTARKNKKDLENVQAEMDQLTTASAVKIAALQQAGNSKADIASVNDATGAQAKTILAETARQVASEKAALAVALKPLKEQADAIQKKIDSYDDRIGQLNKKNQQVLDSQQRLFDLEKKKLTDDYEARLRTQEDTNTATVARLKKERDDLVAALKAKHADDIRKLILKYNPIVTEPAVVAEIDAYGTKAAEYPAMALPDRITSHDLIPTELQDALAARVQRTHLLLARLKAIPTENSVPPMLNALDNAIAESLTGYDGYLAPLAAHMSYLDSVIAQREATIAERDATIAERDATIAQLKADMVAELADRKAAEEKALADRKAAEEAALADRKAAEAAEAADRAAERDRAAALLARWTVPVDQYVGTFREWDGLLIDVRDPADWLSVLKPERAKALVAAMDAAATAPPPKNPPKTPPPPLNLAIVRDGLNNSELGTVTVEPVDGGGWKATLVKQNDPKRPFKAFDRLVLSLPNKK